MALTDEEVEAVLAECSHRGATFTLGGRMAIDGRRVVDMTTPTVDSRGVRGWSRGGCGEPFDDDAGEAEIVEAAYRAALSFAAHEVGEFFLLRGERPFDPHAAAV